jgi:hypothetical protein
MAGTGRQLNPETPDLALLLRDTTMIERIAEFCIRGRVWVTGVLFSLTLILSWFALHI